MRGKILFFCLLFLECIFVLPAYCTSDPAEGTWKGWWTGPLLAPAGHTMAAGMINWEPYLFVTDDFGFYDHAHRHHSTPQTTTVNPLLSLTMGLNNFMDLQFIFQTFYNRKQGQSSFRVGDTVAYLGFQVLEDKQGSWVPDLRFTYNQIFPTGQFRQLDPAKLGTDSSGGGSWAPGASLNFQKLFRIYNEHFFRLRVSFTFTYFIPVNVRGFSSYGGGVGTKGKVFPGNTYTTYVSFEYNLTRHWVLAMDTEYIYSEKTRFSGKPGTTLAGTPAMVGKPSSDQLSLAPAIEYNFNESLGIIAGVWFSVTGRNIDEFISGSIAVNYAY